MNAITKPPFDVDRIRDEFPILRQTVRGKPLVFLDSAASAMKPRAVISAMTEAMETQYANVHRGLHWMSERTTDAYEGVRDLVAGLLNAPSREEIVFAKNSTEAINLVAHSYGRGRCCATRRASRCGFARLRTRASSTWGRWKPCWPTAGWGWSP